MRRRTTVIVAVAVACTTATAGVALALRPSGTTSEDKASPHTVAIEKGALSSGLELSGQLGYGTPVDIVGDGGVVTALPEAGAIIPTGQPLYSHDGRPAFLLRGDKPLWRTLKLGDVGTDVVALRAALAAAGYDAGNAASNTYDAALAKAVGRYYTDRSYPEPSATDATAKDRQEAADALSTAKGELANAQATLSTKAKGTPRSDVVAAQAAVAQAQRDLAAAQEVERKVSASPTPTPTPTPTPAADGAALAAPAPAPTSTPLPTLDEARAAVAKASDDVVVAQAKLADAQKAPDDAPEKAAVTAAQQKVNAAQQKVDAAAGNQAGPSDFVLIPQDSLRVDTMHVVVGEKITGPVLSWTTAGVKAFADLSATQSASIATGTATTVRLPDNTEVPGTVTAILPAEKKKGDGTETKPRAQVELSDPAAGKSLGAVRIILPGEQVSDALIVPVTALVALAEGGYAVQVAAAASESTAKPTLVPVKVGLIADTRAQVITDALKAGDKVVIP